jgi:hypothetical protein
MKSRYLIPVAAILIAAFVTTLLATGSALHEFDEPRTVMAVSEVIRTARLMFVATLAHALLLSLPTRRQAGVMPGITVYRKRWSHKESRVLSVAVQPACLLRNERSRLESRRAFGSDERQFFWRFHVTPPKSRGILTQLLTSFQTCARGSSVAHGCGAYLSSQNSPAPFCCRDLKHPSACQSNY